MIIRILGSASREFHGVEYNDKKIEKGKGELKVMKNFPSFLNAESSPAEVRNYLKTVSQSHKVKKPQFHATISCKFQEFSKEELTRTAELVMDGLGYGEQPYIVVFHNDTENNHVHIVTTRVDKKTSRKINDSFEKLKAQKVLAAAKERLFGISQDEKLETLMSYRLSSLKQLETLLERSGFKLVPAKNGEGFSILKNGVLQRSLRNNEPRFDAPNLAARKKQIKAIISKYASLASPKVFRVEDGRKSEGLFEKNSDGKPKIEWESELQKKLREMFGIDIVFHCRDDQQPFGCTVIDHKNEAVYKGSEIFRMNEIFEFTSDTIDKRLFERLKDFNVRNETEREILIKALSESVSPLKDFMVFKNASKRDREIHKNFRDEVLHYLKTGKGDHVQILRGENGSFYALNHRSHQIESVISLIGQNNFEQIFYPGQNRNAGATDATRNESSQVNKLLGELLESSYTAKDPAEDELKRKRKKRKI